MEKLRPFHMPNKERLKLYLNSSSHLPPLDINKLEVVMLEHGERNALQTPTTGDASLVVTYKRKEGAVSSFGVNKTDLEVLQLQGAKPAGYRINTGLHWPALFAEQIGQIIKHPESTFKRITMPDISVILGIEDATEAAPLRYKAFREKLGMSFSQEEERWVKEY